MFQTFDPPADAGSGSERIRRLRRLVPELGVDAVLVPRADEHQGEYVPACADRLKWLTGFTGSAGLAVIAKRGAALFVDGRYTLQASRQVDTDLLEIVKVPDAKVTDWLIGHLTKGSVIGFDPRLHTVSGIEAMSGALSAKGIKLKALSRNPVDRLWGKERPDPPRGLVVPHPDALAGTRAADKIANLQAKLKAERQAAVVLTLPDSISWLFNVRGSDVPHTPVVLAFAVVPDDGRPELYVDPAKIGPEAKAHLTPLVTMKRPEELADRLKALKQAGRKVRLDPDSAGYWIAQQLGPKTVARAADPCIAPKAAKNAVELAGTRKAHERDGVAMVRYLAWLDREAPSGKLDEITAAKTLEEIRRDTQALKEISFDTISGSGPNSAIVHYRVTTATNRKLKAGELFLVDSGGQYADGTTDITRTIGIGAVSQEMRERFTLVLKGHIAIATARFPKGTRGIDLDPLARIALWRRGLDFDHGTGHGVGSYLSVHEGPASISKRGLATLEPGMILSNEPGYYKDGHYGIRIENLVVVTPPGRIAGGDREMMGFETITLAPIDRRLVVASLLSEAERGWLDDYHARVRKALSAQVRGEDLAWLEAATRPIE